MTYLSRVHWQLTFLAQQRPVGEKWEVWDSFLTDGQIEEVERLATVLGFDGFDDMEKAYRLRVFDAAEWHQLQHEFDQNQWLETQSYHQSLGV